MQLLTLSPCYALLEKEPLQKVSIFGAILVRIFPELELNTERYKSISPYSFQMRENADHNNSEYGHFLRREHRYNFNKAINCKTWERLRRIF